MAKAYKYTKSFTFDGRRYFIRGNTLEEVYTKLGAKKQMLEEGKIVLSGSTTVKAWSEICFSTYKPNLSDRVREAMMYRVNRHIIQAIGAYPLKAVTPLQCQQILSAQSKMSYSHIRALYQELKFIFETAKKNHFILENPAADLSIPKGRKGTRRSVTEAERAALLAVVDKYPSYMLFALMMACGCRPGEAMEIRGKDIQLVEGVPMLHIRGTKTENSDRYVPLDPQIYAKIKDTPHEEVVSPNARGRKHTESSYKRTVARLKRDMNIEMGATLYRNELIPPLPLAEDFVPYDLRHTYCTDLCKKGIDVRIAQKLMGHSSIKITADIYTHVDLGELSKVSALLYPGCNSGCNTQTMKNCAK